jgi:hypothetical protein
MFLSLDFDKMKVATLNERVICNCYLSVLSYAIVRLQIEFVAMAKQITE